MASLLSRNIHRRVFSGRPSNAGLCVQSRPYSSAPFVSNQAKGEGLGEQMARYAAELRGGAGFLTASLLYAFCYWIDLNHMRSGPEGFDALIYRSGPEGFDAFIYRLWQENMLADLNKMQRKLDGYELKLHERKHKNNAPVKVQSARPSAE